MKRSPMMLALASIAVLALTANAGNFPRVVAYQGRVTDNANVPVTDPAADFQFRLYKQAAAGSILWSESATLAVADGLFSHNLGSSCPGCSIPDNIFLSNDTLYLEIQFEAQVISPRVILTASPFAYRVASVDRANGGTITGEVVINGSALGNQLEVNNSGPGRAGYFQNSNVANTEAALLGFHNGSQPGGLFFSELGPGLVASSNTPDAAEMNGSVDINGDFRSLQLRNNSDQLRAELGLNADGALLSLRSSGGFEGVFMSGGIFGDDGVVLSSGAISSFETLDEPGIANNADLPSASLGNSASTITSRTLVAPADGYIVAMATGYINMSHDSGSASTVEVYLTDDVGDAIDKPSTQWRISVNGVSGQYESPYAVQGVFAATAGNNSVFLRASKNGATFGNLVETQLTLMYFPTAYGAVEPAMLPANPSDPAMQSHTAGDDPVRAAEIERLRLKKEVDRLRAQLDRILLRLESNSQN